MQYYSLSQENLIDVPVTGNIGKETAQKEGTPDLGTQESDPQ